MERNCAGIPCDDDRVLLDGLRKKAADLVRGHSVHLKPPCYLTSVADARPAPLAVIPPQHAFSRTHRH
jgi:hypothetical protein